MTSFISTHNYEIKSYVKDGMDLHISIVIKFETYFDPLFDERTYSSDFYR